MGKGHLILITGAARSGKSSFAEHLANLTSEKVAYLATAQALDEEMAERIRLHAERRPHTWQTFEEPFNAGEVIHNHCREYKVWLLDCITLLVANHLLSKVQPQDTVFVSTEIEAFITKEIENLIKVVHTTAITLIAVTNEVGWGLVPPDPISRAYRDIVGRVNQKLAQAANEVYLVTVGIPLKLKSAANGSGL